jgi:hypothetical protein
MSDDDNATNGGITPMQQLADQVGAMQTQIDALTTRLTAIESEHAGRRQPWYRRSVSPASPCGGNDETPTPTKG